MTLEVEFNKNPTPTAPVRERIAQDINMTERSVQIWFQNRRAKIKNIAKRSIESGEDCDTIPDSMRNYLAMQAFGPSKGLPPGLLARSGPGLFPYASGSLCLTTDSSTGKTVIQHFHCRSLAIGTWRRVGQNSMDLIIFYCPERACITYYIHNDASGYKIEYPFAWIKNISLEQGDVLSPAEGASQGSGGLVVELTRPPKFYMDSSNSGGFYECGDFTEDRQASKVMLHHLGGPSKVLSGQLAKLVSLEAYQNRHHSYDPTSFAVSAPVSPVGHRPASQPNHLVHPHNPMSLYPPQDPSAGLMGPPGPRGHKRQRSRSVPAAVDFSMLRQPMPSFLIQHDIQPAPPPVQDTHIFAPQPQHQHPNAFAPGPLGPNLSIDTSSGYGMDFRPFGGSISATTLNSPSDFGTPGFFTSNGATGADIVHPPHFVNPFNNGYLAVDPAAMLGTSHTPLSVNSHADPVIADHSPPLSGMGRSQSTDVFGTPGDNSQFGDDATFLSESFNKQINLPFRGSLNDDSFQSPMHEGTFTFEGPTPGSDGQMHFQTPPPLQTQDGSLDFHSPSLPPQQMHQDSAVSFSTPSQQMHHNDHADPGSVYQDSKVYESPAQVQQISEDHHNPYHQSPMYHHGTPATDYEMRNFIDPTSLGQPR